MRYSVYKELKNLSDSVVEAVNYLKSKPEAVGILADCVVAISAIKDTFIKNSIELSEVDNFLEITEKIMDCLEAGKQYLEYIDTLFELSQKINIYCKNDVKYKFKIVFLAELGSKWDSMDSVYRAYKNREDCEVEVVIAPIYRAIKLPNGKIKHDVIYEDYLTSLGIKHTLYKDYDIKKDLPDITFTSQPYESVTPEMFWAENIAPYTRLVYLPYFTTYCMTSEQEIYVQCQMPIYNLAWRVICQSEKLKTIYSKYFKSKGENIIASGLPKWDWVINMDNREIKLPEGWEKLEGKKVILKNYHYNFRNPKGRMLHIKNDIDNLNKDTEAMILRFHPMTETMFNVYYPEFKEEWEQLKNEINNLPNCVIDNNIMYDYSFKFSDAMTSDISSIVWQYMLTKKPIILLYLSYLKEAKAQEENDGYILKPSTLSWAVNDMEEFNKVKNKLFYEGDYNYEERVKFMNENFPNADGHIGERLANQLINEMLKEDIGLSE